MTLQTNTVADSTLTVVNCCRENHQFQIQWQNVRFLHLTVNRVHVKGGQTQVLPAKFDTRNVAPGVYHGTELVVCQTCKNQRTCTQCQEVWQVILRVTDESGATGQPPSAPTAPNQPTSPTTNPGPQTTVPVGLNAPAQKAL